MRNTPAQRSPCITLTKRSICNTPAQKNPCITLTQRSVCNTRIRRSPFFSVLRRNRFGGSEVWSFYSKNPSQLYQIHQIRTYVPLQSKPFATVSDPSDQKLCSFMIEIPTRPFITASDRKFCSFQSRSPTRPFTTVLRPPDQKLCSFMVETPDETLYNRIRSIYPHPPGKTPISLG